MVFFLDFEEVQYNAFMYLLCDVHVFTKAECREFFSGSSERAGHGGHFLPGEGSSTEEPMSGLPS